MLEDVAAAMDADSAADHLLETNGLLPLLLALQADVSSKESKAAAKEIDKLIVVGEKRLRAAGWFPLKSGSTVGSQIWQRGDEESEDPAANMGWKTQLLASLPLLRKPATLGGETVWAVRVVHHDDAERLSVLDIVEHEEDGTVAVVRHVIRGIWRGCAFPTAGSFDMAQSPGQHLETWTATTLAGMAILAHASQVLIIGAASGLCAFLARRAQVDVLDNPAIVIVAQRFLGLWTGQEDPGEYQGPGSRSPWGSRRKPIGRGASPPPVTVLRELGSKRYDAVLVEADAGKWFASISHEMLIALTHVAPVIAIANGCPGSGRKLCEHSLRDKGDLETVVVHGLEVSISAWQLASAGLPGPMEVALASQTQAVRVCNFFTDHDIERIVDVPSDLGQEIRGGSPLWRVWYWQTGGKFPSDLESRIRKLGQDAAEREGWDFKGSSMNLRVAEYHEQRGGSPGLADPHHYDQDSLVTVDILLSDASAFEGGVFTTEEADGSMKAHAVQKGDALIFVSHKYHMVTPVTKGCRKVLVVEFWAHPARTCPHRCLSAGPTCGAEAFPFSLGSVDESPNGLRLLWQEAGQAANNVKLPDRLSSEDQAWDLFS